MVLAEPLEEASEKYANCLMQKVEPQIKMNKDEKAIVEYTFYECRQEEQQFAYSCLNIPPIPIHTIPPIPISTIPVKVLIERYRNRGRRFGSSLRFNLIASTLFIIYN